MDLHGLDPAEIRPLRRLEASDFALRSMESEAFRHLASVEMDRLFKLVGHSASGLFLTDRDGIVIDRRCLDADAADFLAIGLVPGADCSEKSEGTNGMGTCLAENRPVIIHREEHYFARSMEFTCIGAPVFGANGDLIGVLDLSTARAGHPSEANLLLASAVVQTAHRIESAVFNHWHQSERIVVADTGGPEDLALLAVDKDDFVVGATRAARLAFGMGLGVSIDPRPAADVLGGEESARDIAEIRRAAILRALSRAGGNVSAAARQLGMGRATLYTQMKRLGIRD